MHGGATFLSGCTKKREDTKTKEASSVPWPRQPPPRRCPPPPRRSHHRPPRRAGAAVSARRESAGALSAPSQPRPPRLRRSRGLLAPPRPPPRQSRMRCPRTGRQRTARARALQHLLQPRPRASPSHHSCALQELCGAIQATKLVQKVYETKSFSQRNNTFLCTTYKYARTPTSSVRKKSHTLNVSQSGAHDV